MIIKKLALAATMLMLGIACAGCTEPKEKDTTNTAMLASRQGYTGYNPADGLPDLIAYGEAAMDAMGDYIPGSAQAAVAQVASSSSALNSKIGAQISAFNSSPLDTTMPKLVKPSITMSVPSLDTSQPNIQQPNFPKIDTSGFGPAPDVETPEISVPDVSIPKGFADGVMSNVLNPDTSTYSLPPLQNLPAPDPLPDKEQLLSE